VLELREESAVDLADHRHHHAGFGLHRLLVGREVPGRPRSLQIADMTEEAACAREPRQPEPAQVVQHDVAQLVVGDVFREHLEIGEGPRRARLRGEHGREEGEGGEQAGDAHRDGPRETMRGN